MKKILGLVAIMLMVTPAFGASTITYELQLGGNNHADQWEQGTVVPYTPGSTADGQVIEEGQIVNWAVTAAAGGDTGGNGIFGAANLVWDLELWQGATLVAVGAGSPTTQGWFSTINDGDNGGGTQPNADPLQLAAFAFSFDVGMGSEPGRVWDAVDDNGPHMAQKTYPSAAGFPAASTAEAGKLVGMGAGYTKYQAAANQERAGVGIVGDFGDPAFPCTGLGRGPIAEGQLNMAGLASGTYTLKLVPGNGNNVLKNDATYFCEVGTDGNFAVKADQVGGDEISFVYEGGVTPCDPPVLTAAVSRRMHAGTPWDIALNLPGAGNAVVEPRQNGPQSIVLTYNKAIGGTITSSVGTATKTGDQEVTVALSGITDGACVEITLNGVACAEQPTSIAAAHTVRVRAIYGDVNGNGSVNVADIGLVKSKSGLPLDASSFRMDLNANGSVNVADIGLVKSRSGITSAAPCPNTN